MDGTRLHGVTGVAEALAERKTTVLYLLPYSPELNPIEIAWAWLKARFQKVATETIGVFGETVE